MVIFKRILCVLAALAMIAAATGLFYWQIHDDPDARSFSDSDSGKSMFLEQVEAAFDVQPDGGLHVTESITYDLGSVAWRGLYQDIILAHGEQVESVRVSRVTAGREERLGSGSGIELGVGGAYGTYGYGVIKDPDRRLRIVWNVNDTGSQTFIVRYRLTKAAQNYRDASTLLWDVWGKGWETGVGRLKVFVGFPGRIKVFYPRAGELQRRVLDTQVRRDVGSFSVVNLPEQRQVQVRAAAAPLTRMPRQPERILPTIEREQAEIDEFNVEQAERSVELRDQSFLIFLAQALAAALIGLLLIVLAWYWLGRDRTKMISAGGTYQYPPEKIPAPVIAKALGGEDTDNLVSATLLGFLQRDVFRVLPSVEKKEDVSIRNNVGETTYDVTKVAEYERPIADLLQLAIDKHEEHSPDFTKLKKYLDAETAESKISAYEKALKSAYSGYGLKSTYRGRVRRWVIGILALLGYVLGLVIILGTSGGNAAARYDQMQPGLWLAGIMPVLLWAAVDGNVFYRLKSDQEERVRKWETYQDFFAKMDMSNQYPLTVEIWDEALLYAAAFGYAKKVITNMPRTTQTGSPAPFASGTNMGLVAMNAGSISALGSMTSGISGVTGMASSSSSGGGGFSGGGSGGGGGGGW